MDGSASSVSSMSSGSKSSRRSKIIGGIIGGAVGLVLLLLGVHCLVLAFRRRNRRRRAESDPRFRDVEKTENFKTHRNPSRNPKNLSVTTNSLGTDGPLRTARPLPREPRSAPSLPENTNAGAVRAWPQYSTPGAVASVEHYGFNPKMQSIQSPQPPPPRKVTAARPNSDDPFA